MPGARAGARADDAGQQRQQASGSAPRDQALRVTSRARKGAARRAPCQEAQQHRHVDARTAPGRPAARVQPETSTSHGPGPQRLHRDQAAVEEEAQRREAQERRVAEDLPRSRRQRRRPRRCRDAAGVARARSQAISASVASSQRSAATAQNRPRQTDHRQQPLHRQRRRDHAQRARHQHPRIGAQLRRRREAAPKAVIGAIRQALTPTPISARASVRPDEAARQGERRAAEHRDQQEADQRLGAGRSDPARCRAAAGSPRSRRSRRRPAAPGRRRCRPSSALKIGASVAVTPRNRAEKK